LQVFGAGDVNGIDLLPGLIFQVAGQTDEVDGGDNDRGIIGVLILMKLMNNKKFMNVSTCAQQMHF
jgi:hypothetical protein